MIVRKVLGILPAAALFLFVAGEVRAGGFGIYGGYGQGEVAAKRDAAAGTYEFDQKATHTGIGLAYESNVLDEKPFGWRAALGYEKLDLEVDGGDGPFTDGLESDCKGRLVLDADFEYGAKAGSRVRYWGGATARLGFYSGQDGSNIGPRDQKFFSGGIGPAVGLKVGITESVALTLRGGYLFSYYQGRWTDWTVVPRSREDMSATEGNWFLGAALLVKTGPLSWLDDEEEKEEADTF